MAYKFGGRWRCCSWQVAWRPVAYKFGGRWRCCSWQVARRPVAYKFGGGGQPRSAFLIDEKGKVEQAWYKISPKDTPLKLLAALKD